MGWGKNRRGSASSAASSGGRGGRRRPPAEPTEHDIARCVQQSAARVRVSLQLTAEVDSPSLRDVLAGFERDLETRREPAAAHGLDARVELLECGLGSWQQLVALQRVVAALQRQNRPPLAAKTTLRHDAKYDEWTLALSFARAADDALWTLASGLVLRLKSGGVPARVLLPAHRLALPLASAFVEGHIGEYQWEGRLTWRQAVVEGIGEHREEIQRVLLPPSRDNSTSGEDPPAALRYPELVPVVEDMLKGNAGARKPVVVILRGIPGSGKSTLRREIEAICRHGGVAFTACSADFFFETPRGYVFDARKLGAAHSKCRGDFTRAVHGEIPRNQGAGKQRRPHQHVVLVDNTSTQRWEYEPYEDIARSSGCRVHIVEMKCPNVLTAYRMGQRNSHGVPPDKVTSRATREVFPARVPRSKLTCAPSICWPFQLLYPGDWVTDALRALVELRPLCETLLGRLVAICGYTDHFRQQDRASTDVTPADSEWPAQVDAALSRFTLLLESVAATESAVFRLAVAPSPVRELRSLHVWLDASFRGLHAEHVDPNASWAQEWEEELERVEQALQHAARMQVDAAAESSDNEQREMIAVVKFAFKQVQDVTRRTKKKKPGRSYASSNDGATEVQKDAGAELFPDHEESLRVLFRTLVRVCGVQVPVLPSWFLSPAEVALNPATRFRSGPQCQITSASWMRSRGQQMGGVQQLLIKQLVAGTGANAQSEPVLTQAVEAVHNETELLRDVVCHPHVLQLAGASTFGSQPFVAFVSPWAAPESGSATVTSLEDYLDLSVDHRRQLFRLLAQAATGLQSLHEASLIHGDLCCANIVVGDDESFRFRGLAMDPRWRDRGSALPQPGPLSHILTTNGDENHYENKAGGTAEPFSIEMWFALAEHGDTFLGGILLGAQDLPFQETSDASGWPYVHHQLLSIDPMGNLWCSFLNRPTPICVARELSPNHWYHLVVTYGGDSGSDCASFTRNEQPEQLLSVYLNGEQRVTDSGVLLADWAKLRHVNVGSGCISGLAPAWPEPHFSGWFGFSGLVFDMRVWRRKELSGSQVQLLFRGSSDFIDDPSYSLRRDLLGDTVDQASPNSARQRERSSSARARLQGPPFAELVRTTWPRQVGAQVYS
ncbi:TKL/TKL-CCIN protein kinase [Phytophthora cinnamomi]|uniref:TKL/TKL-CCIN protein kinase n=1 Tax=Phytophthora cinnamomi TaxID=4785 RepID=UPI0035598E04|nr:TKL/TKL-CCIN protein kinase [Phytophthora cinnamomi]